MILREGWILDVYTAGRAMAVWIVDKHGKSHRLRDAFAPAFYAGGDPQDLQALAGYLLAQPWGTLVSFTYRRDPALDHPVQVLKVQVRDPRLYGTILRRVKKLRTSLTFENASATVPQMYLSEKHAYPLAFCRFATGDDNRLYGVEVVPSPYVITPASPPLKQMVIRFAGDAWHPHLARRGPLEVEIAAQIRHLPVTRPRALLESLRGLLLRHDPDVIVTDWGDSIVLPYLVRLSTKYGIPLPLGRDPTMPPPVCPARGYFSYGLVARRAAPQTLHGRIHIDRKRAPPAGDAACTPPFIAAARVEMMEALKRARSGQARHACVPRLIEIACGYADALYSGRVPFQELVISEPLSREPQAYGGDRQLAIAAQELLGDGALPSAGQAMHYLFMNAHTPAERDRLQPSAHYRGHAAYDAQRYIALLVRAVASVLAPLGIGEEEIAQAVNAGAHRPTPVCSRGVST